MLLRKGGNPTYGLVQLLFWRTRIFAARYLILHGGKRRNNNGVIGMMGVLVSQHNFLVWFEYGSYFSHRGFCMWLQVTGCGEASLGRCLWVKSWENPYPFG